jgi:hypothetical protein
LQFNEIIIIMIIIKSHWDCADSNSDSKPVTLPCVLQVSGWQERAPRSISRDYDAINSNALVPGDNAKVSSDVVPASGTSGPSRPSRPVGTQLSDVFISVKTTRNYHKWRLPVLLKTWFQLAKAQVSSGISRPAAGQPVPTMGRLCSLLIFRAVGLNFNSVALVREQTIPTVKRILYPVFIHVPPPPFLILILKSWH